MMRVCRGGCSKGVFWGRIEVVGEVKFEGSVIYIFSV